MCRTPIKPLPPRLQLEFDRIKGNKIRVTRSIVVEGDRDWVEETIARSHLPDEDDDYPTPHGSVRCTQVMVEPVYGEEE